MAERDEIFSLESRGRHCCSSLVTFKRRETDEKTKAACHAVDYSTDFSHHLTDPNFFHPLKTCGLHFTNAFCTVQNLSVTFGFLWIVNLRTQVTVESSIQSLSMYE